MKKVDYYALITYRGLDKIYYILAEEEKDLRIEYIRYKANREYDKVWVKNGKEKIKQVFNDKSKEYKYFKELDRIWKGYIIEHSRIYNKGSLMIGTLSFQSTFNKALKEVGNPYNLKF